MTLLFGLMQAARAWNGHGTENSPYLIQSAADWKQLATTVAGGDNCFGKVFMLTTDIRVDGDVVGTSKTPFHGIFDGGNHTLTFNKGMLNGSAAFDPELSAPFAYVANATLRHLRTEGSIFTTHQFGAGIVGLIGGAGTTTLTDCSSGMSVNAQHSGDNDAAGGLVGAVNTGRLTMEGCLFDGTISVNGTAGGMVGWSNVPVTISFSMVSPQQRVAVSAGNGKTFVRMAGGVKATLNDCFFTNIVGDDSQGTGVFTHVEVPEGCTATMVGEPTIQFRGTNYYASGAKVKLTVANGTAFDHWFSPGTPTGCYVSDPWRAEGTHTLSDIKGTPVLRIATSMPSAKLEREVMGINYRYLSGNDYKLYLSDETCRAKGYQLDDDGYLFVYDAEGTKNFVTAVTSCDPSDELFQNFITSGWLWSTRQYEGSLVKNDIVSDLWEHTHLAVIAPRAFKNVGQLKRITFMSNTDAQLRSDCNTPLDLYVDEEAFAGCQNLTEFVMMYYNNKDNKWETLTPTSGVRIADNAFEGSPCHIVVDQSVYQDFLSSDAWEAHHDRIGLYISSAEDIRQDGAIYSYMRDSQGNAVQNDAAGREVMRRNMVAWNADYKNFNAANLLAGDEKKNIWYAQVVGVDDSSLDNGRMIIRNDPGTYFNYKTVAIKSGAFEGNKNLKYIEFAQVVGNRNSYSNFKIVIQNGAFRGCTNLKELRMFYYVNESSTGENVAPHWQALGPQDVVPGNMIFGHTQLSDEELMNIKDVDASTIDRIPEDFRILVAPERYKEFLDDPNWVPYLPYIIPQNLTPDNGSDFTIGDQKGITYGYITNLGGIRETSQTVSQDLSWWTLPRIAAEVALYVATLGTYAANSAVIGNLSKTTQSLSVVTAQKEFVVGAQTAAQGVANADALSLTARASEFFGTYGGRDVVDLGLMGISFPDRIALDQSGIMVNGAIMTRAQFGASSLGQGALKNGFTALTQCLQDAVPILQEQINTYLADLAIYTSVHILGGLSVTSTTAGIISAACWNNNYSSDALKKGMRENIRSNMHQVGVHGGGYVYTTPTKNLVYHTYIKEVKDDVKEAVIYAGTDRGQGANASSVTMTFGRDVFQNHKNLEKVWFHENNISTNEGMPMLLTIPDSAFVGCDKLVEFSTLLQTKDNGWQALGPESFILGGDSIFAGLDSLKFHILIDESRKEDYLASESWSHLKRYFKYTNVLPAVEHDEYGGWYGYAYERASLQKIHKVEGHKIEHMVVVKPDDDFLKGHQGALKLCNDIGSYNNYQLDAVRYAAFRGNDNLRVVNFTDLKGTTGFGDVYTGLDVTLQDSCFANCRNLANIDMLYLVTDGPNRIDPITPQQVKLGRGVLAGTTAQIKMMPKQLEWFEADTTWNKYRDRFLPCIIQPTDDEVKSALKDMAYYDMAHTGYDDTYWTDYIDLARIGGAGFDWLNGRFSGKDIRSFNDFRHFACVGLDFVGEGWFKDCRLLSSIALPNTIKRVGSSAFDGCSALTSIELPATVESIGEQAFNNCQALTSVRVLATTPAKLEGSNQFTKNISLKIYVPDASVQLYRKQWAEYKDYIASDKMFRTRKVIHVSGVGQLAEKLKLAVEKERGKIRYLNGDYSHIDSLTVVGPINGDDLGVIRHLAGADAYDSAPTDGKLKYLNLWNADIRKDDVNSYNGNGIDEYIDADNKVPDYLFENCTSIETVVFPKSVTYIGENIFEDAASLKRVCVGSNTTEYKCDILQSLKGIQELVMLTDSHATSTYDDPWEAPIDVVYTTKSQIGNYMGDENLTLRAQLVVAPFEDDGVMKTLSDKGHFFPSDYFMRKSVEGIFNDNATISRFNDFWRFIEVKNLEQTFSNASELCTITLPDSLKSIGIDAFAGCSKLDTIYVNCDSVPAMAAGALRDLPADFRILVPKKLCKLYRSKWAEYADHINVNETANANNNVVTVVLTEPNTLAKALGLTTRENSNMLGHTCLGGISGDYSMLRRLKVVGPISGEDFDLMRHLAGYTPWIQTRNMAGHLEYIDLYDANIVETDRYVNGELSSWKGHQSYLYSVDDNELPYHAFLKAYSLKTLILPKTCKKVSARALQECEELETLVVGDDMEDFNWNALDDDASLTRMYILSKKKMAISTQFAVWRWLCNNYNPTFDAFYVRPSLLEEYRSDNDYTSSSWQRTNNIQKGVFDSDDEFCAFAAHAAATYDDMAAITSVDGWFKGHEGIRDLAPLRYTAISALHADDIQPLAQLEHIALPATLETVDDNVFANATKLRWADMLLCDSAMVDDSYKDDLRRKLGLNAYALLYVPNKFAENREQNVVAVHAANAEDNMSGDRSVGHCYYFNLYDGWDYDVPYGFTTDFTRLSRQLLPNMATTICLPYKQQIPYQTEAYKLTGRRGRELVFTKVNSDLEALKPYLLVSTNRNYVINDFKTDVPANGGQTIGHDVNVMGATLRGTLGQIDAATAVEMEVRTLNPTTKTWDKVSLSSKGTANSSLKPFMAFLMLPGSNSVVGTVLENAGGSIPTDIDTLTTIDEDGTEHYYDLQGRELPGKPARGVYIKNGKKFTK